jgi:hypothetical protein
VNYHAILLTFHQLTAPFPTIPALSKSIYFRLPAAKALLLSYSSAGSEKISLLGSGKAFAQTFTTSSLSPDQR